MYQRWLLLLLLPTHTESRHAANIYCLIAIQTSSTDFSPFFASSCCSTQPFPLLIFTKHFRVRLLSLEGISSRPENVLIDNQLHPIPINLLHSISHHGT